MPLVTLLCACGAEIGDDCSTNVDCSQNGDRICDKSLPGGYCTVEGCDEGTCPEEAICVRFFPVNGLVHTCLDAGDCTVDDVCLSDGFCAARLSERRFCMRACGQDYQCRDGYVCRFTGVAGVELAQAPGDPAGFSPDRVGRFCGPPLSPR
jgi:hypothetical protein